MRLRTCTCAFVCIVTKNALTVFEPCKNTVRIDAAAAGAHRSPASIACGLLIADTRSMVVLIPFCLLSSFFFWILRVFFLRPWLLLLSLSHVLFVFWIVLFYLIPLWGRGFTDVFIMRSSMENWKSSCWPIHVCMHSSEKLVSSVESRSRWIHYKKITSTWVAPVAAMWKVTWPCCSALEFLFAFAEDALKNPCLHTHAFVGGGLRIPWTTTRASVSR